MNKEEAMEEIRLYGRVERNDVVLCACDDSGPCDYGLYINGRLHRGTSEELDKSGLVETFLRITER